MLKQGIHIDDFIKNGRKSSQEDFLAFEMDIVIGEYPIGHYDSFLGDFKNALIDFEKAFTFVRLTKMNWISKSFIDQTIDIDAESDIATSIAYEGFGTEAFFTFMIEDNLGMIFLGVELTLVFENIEREILLRTGFGSLVIGFSTQQGFTKLSLGLNWYLGAEWFYNEYREENSQIVKDAIIKFYESKPQYKELKINYIPAYLDFHVEKYTSKSIEKTLNPFS